MKIDLKIVWVVLFSSASFFSYAQEQGLSVQNQPRTGIVLHLGPSINYFQGQQSDSYEEFNSKRINFQLNAFLGYTSMSGNGNSIGIFGTGGYSNKFTLDEILSIQNINVVDLESSSYNTFYQIEGGMIVSNILRLSTGFGSQDYSAPSGDESIDYLSSTAGLMINFGNVMWNMDANFNYGLDYSHSIIKFSTGLVFIF